MELTFENISYLVLAGAALLAGVFSLRFVFKLARKIIRLALILIGVALVAGCVLGILNITQSAGM
jgi:multisubunit Na+/H+ antiporter MnhC subunit